MKQLGRRPRILLALTLSAALHVVGALATLNLRHIRFVEPLVAPIAFFGWFFEHVFSDSAGAFGFSFGLLLSLAFYAVVAWLILTALGKKRSKSDAPSQELSDFEC
jgi:hypothetical protein